MQVISNRHIRYGQWVFEGLHVLLLPSFLSLLLQGHRLHGKYPGRSKAGNGLLYILLPECQK